MGEEKIRTIPTNEHSEHWLGQPAGKGKVWWYDYEKAEWYVATLGSDQKPSVKMKHYDLPSRPDLD